MKQLLGIDIPATLTFNKTAGTLNITTNQTFTKANMLEDKLIKYSSGVNKVSFESILI